MAGLAQKIMGTLGFGEYDEYDAEFAEPSVYEEQTKETKLGGKGPGKVVRMGGAPSMNVVINKPTDFTEGQEIVDHLKMHKSCIISLENLDVASAKQLFNYLTGATYALDGNMEKVSKNIYVITPCNVDIQADFRDKLKTEKSGYYKFA